MSIEHHGVILNHINIIAFICIRMTIQLAIATDRGPLVSLILSELHGKSISIQRKSQTLFAAYMDMLKKKQEIT